MRKIVKTISIIAAALALAALLAACSSEFDVRPEPEKPEFIPVENISGLTTAVLPYAEIRLSGTVSPEHANNKRILWSIKEFSGTEAELANGRWLIVTEEGTVTVTATIKNGSAEGEDYTQDFDILISPHAIPVSSIDVPQTILIGDYELNCPVVPHNALYQTVLWTVKDAGATGAQIAANTLTTTNAGTVVLTAFVADGRLNGDYKQDFTVEVIPFVPVAEITGIPNEKSVSTNITLNATVSPSNATYKTIEWTIKDAGTTGATITNGSLRTTNDGTVIITATITNGGSNGDYTQDFEIEVQW